MSSVEKIVTAPLLCRNRSVRRWNKCGQENVWMHVCCVLRKPSGRQEVVQLMRMMDDMLLKAGVEEHTEELTEISQVRRQHYVFRLTYGSQFTWQTPCFFFVQIKTGGFDRGEKGWWKCCFFCFYHAMLVGRNLRGKEQYIENRFVRDQADKQKVY